jgi:myosin protein heavy chain/myosin heavy chain 6/7
MDKENLRKQLYEEIHSQFESKLREARREKTQLEEEIEAASEKWRAERRRLNSEIDRLEAKVAEARETRRKSPDASSGKPAEPEEIAKLQAEAEERIQQAAQEFEGERKQFQAEISRLQRGIADLLERSNNPLRTSQAEKEKFESRLEDALRAKRVAEDALLRAKADWEQEKLRLVGESVKLRRPAPEPPKPEPPKAEPPRPAQNDGKSAQLEKKLDETLKSRDSLSQELDRTKQQLKATKEEFEALALQLERSHKERSNLEKQLRESSKPQAEPKVAPAPPAPSEDVRALKDQLDKSQKECASLERQVREASRAQEKLERELDKVRQSPIVAKEVQAVEIDRLREEARAARSETKLAASQIEEIRTAAGKEKASLERQLRETSAQVEKLSRDLDRTQNAASTASKEGGAPAVARLKQEYQEAQAEARLAAAAQKQQHAAELAKVQEELNTTRQKLQQLEGATPSPSNQPVNSEIVEQLQRQYDERMQQAIQEKTQLSDELRNVTAMLDQERQKLATAAGGNHASRNDGVDTPLIDSEVERIQGMIAGIARVIDDPETELSTVIRKNVERAELDAYLKGILFSLGRGKSL